MENLLNRSITFLPLAACQILDLPEDRIDCSRLNETECIFCPILGKFITREGLDDTDSLGHIICLILCFITFIVGTFGTLANLIIIIVLKRQNSGRAFDTFLLGLASFDLLCSVSAVFSGTAAVFFFQNWNRGIVTQYMYYYPLLIVLFSRSGSAFMTVVITVERYLVVAFPMKFGNWFTTKKTRVISVLVLIWAFLMALPRFSSAIISRNNIGKYMERTKFLEYIIVSTPLEKFWYFDMGGYFDVIDFWGPLPLLLLFNGLVYFHIRKFAARRKELNTKHRKDIRAAKMFLPVVIVLFLCNIEPIVNYFCIFNYFMVYRELYMGMLLSFSANAAVNLPIYYFGGSSFKKETKNLMAALFPCVGNWSSDDKNKASGGTGSTSAGKATDGSSSEMGKYN